MTTFLATLIRSAMAIVLAVPLIAIAVLSLSPTKGMDFFARPSEASLRWWGALFTDTSWAEAASTSVYVAVCSTAMALLFVLPAVVYARTNDVRWSRMLVAASGIAFFIPPVVLAVGLYGLVQVSGLFDSVFGLAIAHLSVTTPVLGFILSERLKVSSISTYVVARSLGASPLSAATTWISAQHRLSVIAAAFAAFMGSMSEATIVFFVTDTQTVTVARRVMSGLSQDIDPSSYAAMVVWLVLVGSIAAMMVGSRIRD